MKYTKSGKRIAIITAFFSALLAVILIFTGCSSQSSTTAASTPQKTTVKKGNISNTITATGNLSMPNQAKLTFGSAGTLDQILVTLGDSVKKGQVLAKLDTVTISSLNQALIQAQIAVKTAQMNLDNAKTPTLSSGGSSVSAPDPLNIESKELALQSAQLNLESAQKQLDGSTLIAPFDGLIAAINNLVGDKVSASTIVIRMIDPTQLQVDTLVNEMDIFNVKLGGPATIQVSALSSLTLPATVFAISPSASVSSGVVNYTVQLRVNSSQAARAALSGGSSDNSTTGAPRQFGGTNNSTQQGAPGAAGQFAGTGQRPSGSNGSPTQAAAATTAIPSTLKEGLSVSITIVIQQKNDVLLLPSRALTRSGRTTTVELVNANGTTTQQTVTTGLSDWQNTEIVSGLTEGQTVLIPTTSSTSSTTTTPRVNVPGLGGLGGPGR
jgi:RND family efflux transporter MFP subunit